MPTMLESWCQVNNLILKRGLIQNEEAVDIDSARKVVCYALRWRHRVCKSCGGEFDISQRGFLYSCGNCSPV